MKKTTRGIGLLLTYLMSLALSTSIVTAQSNNLMVALPAQFTDVPSNHPNAKAINYLHNNNIIEGYPDGTFKPNQLVNRVEALKLILLGAKISTDQWKKAASFTDTKNAQWYSPYLNTASYLAIIGGYPDGSFRPTQTVNLVENLKMLILARKIDISKIITTQDPYADAFRNQWYTPHVQYAKENKLIDADSQNKIYPSRGMTRGQLAEVMYRFMTLPQPGTTTMQPSPSPASTNLYDLTGLVLKLDIQNSGFSKESMTVGTGTTVQWINQDKVAHTVTSDDGQFDSGSIAPGKSFSFTFKANGVYNYHCTFHPGMKANIIVKPAIQVPSI